jgi:predicted DNA-binding transcriptional regulator YafY
MSYEKAADLLDLAMEIQAQRYGLSYAAIDERSDAPSQEGRRRNTQRLVKALERVFGDRLTIGTGETGERTVRLASDQLRQLTDLTPAEMAALDLAITVLRASNAVTEAETVKGLRTKIRLLAPQKRMARMEVDYEALLAGSHVVARPGPSPRIDPAVMRPLTEAILAMRQVAFDYPGARGTVRRTVHPYGVIFGHRAYLVALLDGVSGTNPSRWRIDRIANAEVNETPSARPEDFDLAAYAKRAFGGFHSEAEYKEVEWRFAAAVAENVRSFRFHPDQEITEEPDGTVTVRFNACGHLELVWALYPWGD